MPDQRLLQKAVDQARQRPFFLASVLLPWADAEGLDDAALAVRLGCSPDDLPRLLLCRRPAPETFETDTRQIAAGYSLDAYRLAQTIRLAEALLALAAASGSARLLAAARDRDRDRDRDRGQAETGSGAGEGEGEGEEDA